MSTLAEYQAAAKTHANVRRARALKEIQYNTVGQQLQTLIAQEAVALANLQTVVEQLGADVP